MTKEKFKKLFEKHKSKLNERYHKIAGYWIDGAQKSDIARLYGITPQRVGQLINKQITEKLEKYESSGTTKKV